MWVKRWTQSSGLRFLSLFMVVYCVCAVAVCYLAYVLLSNDIKQGGGTDITARGAAITQNISRNEMSNQRVRLEETQRTILLTAALVIPLSLIATFLGGIFFNKITTRRIEVINDHCRSIRKQGDLSLRVPNTKPDDEYGLLIANINAMLSAVDNGVKNVEAVSDDIAHDLRTPLSRMKYALESGLIDQDIAKDQLKTILETTLTETNTLLDTFSAILRISQLHSGQRKAKFQRFNVTALVRTFVEAYTPSAEELGHRLLYSHEEDDCTIDGDKEMLGQLISNLIENSLQHGGGPNNVGLTIRLSLKRDDEAVTLSIEDNGRGIDDEDHDVVFTKFYRGDYSRTDSGNGLGLALVKAIADLHDVKIQLTTLRPGVKFSFAFPRTASIGL